MTIGESVQQFVVESRCGLFGWRPRLWANSRSLDGVGVLRASAIPHPQEQYPMKSNETANSRRILAAMAAWTLVLWGSPCAAALVLDQTSARVRWLGHVVRRLQGSCMVPGNDVASVAIKVDAQVQDEILACVTDPCIIAVDETQAFGELRDACEAARGAFHVFLHVATCTGITLQFNNYPLCWESQTVNSACTIEAAEDFRESKIDVENCTDIASHTGTTDFSISTPSPARATPSPVKATPSPVKATPRPVKATPRPVKATPRPVKATPRPVNATPRPVKVTPSPVSGSVPAAPPSSSPSGSSPGSGTTGSAPTAPPVPVDPTAAPAFPTDSPAAPTDAPVNAIPPEAGECSLSADAVYSANNDLIDEAASILDECLSPPCIIEVDTTQAYSDLIDACEEAKGAFHLYTVKVSCTEYNFQYIKFPACWISQAVNQVCDPDLLGDVLELEVFDSEGCTVTATHTKTFDFGSEEDNPNTTEAPTEAPAALLTTSPPQTALPPSTAEVPRIAGIRSASRALSVTAAQSSRSIVLSLILSLACSPWI
jgi:hypothetical protein